MDYNRILIHTDEDNGLFLLKANNDFDLEIRDTDGELYWDYSLNEWDGRNTCVSAETQVFPWLLYIASTMLTPRLVKVYYDFASDVYRLLNEE